MGSANSDPGGAADRCRSENHLAQRHVQWRRRSREKGAAGIGRITEKDQWSAIPGVDGKKGRFERKDRLREFGRQTAEEGAAVDKHTDRAVRGLLVLLVRRFLSAAALGVPDATRQVRVADHSILLRKTPPKGGDEEEQQDDGLHLAHADILMAFTCLSKLDGWH